LLAKGIKYNISLEEHIDDLIVVSNSFKKAFPIIPSLSQLNEFWKFLEIAIIFHDLGKANRGFQDMLYGNTSYHFRHEWLSASIFLNYDCCSFQKDMILNAILSHHKNYQKLNQIYKESKNAEYDIEDGEEVDLVQNPIFINEFNDLNFEWIKSYLASKNILLEDFKKINPLPLTLQKWIDDDLCEEISEIEKFQNIFLSASLSICDHNASGGIKEIPIINQDKFQFLESNKPYKHQSDSWNSQGNVLLIAPTGQGKTESSLGWLKNQLNIRQGRAFYILPFTASINAMTKRLSSDHKKGINDESLVGLLHSK